MNRIKDFFYNKNDLIVVLLILVLGAGIIYYHVMEIMNYPSKIMADASQTTVTETEATTETEPSSAANETETAEKQETEAVSEEE